MIVSIHQPNYLPWIGFFRKLALSDKFVFFDDVQFEKGGYTNRVKIKNNGGVKWITQPINKKNILDLLIIDISFSSDGDWRRSHYDSFAQNYRKESHFRVVNKVLEDIYGCRVESLVDFNINALNIILNLLDLNTEIYRSSQLNYSRNCAPSEKIASICTELRAEIYLSGRGAIKYNDPLIFSSHNIRLAYDNWTEVGALSGVDIVPGLSILHALTCMGVDVVRSALFDEVHNS